MASALERIRAIREKAEREVEVIKSEAISEVAKRRSALLEQLAAVDKEYEELTGKTVKGERLRKAAGNDGKRSPKADVGDEAELERLLKSAPNHRLNRKGFLAAGYNLPSAILIAKENPKKFGHEQNKAQGSVWLK